MRIVFVLARGCWKEFARDRIFYLALLVAVLMVGFSYLLATLTIIESRKILLDFGFSALSLAGACISIFLGIRAVSREIEGHIIYTVITKPVSRPAYLLGKFLGSAMVVLATQGLLSLALAGIVLVAGEGLPRGFVACCGFIALENLVVLAFAFLVSIPFSTVMATGLTFFFFLMGRSSGALEVMAQRANTEEVKRLARALYLIFPNFERFNLRDVVAYGHPYPPEMIGRGLVYALAYIVVCLGLAVVTFRKRDIA